MAASKLGFMDYVKAAFRWRHRVPLLGRIPLHYLFLATFGVLGLANPGFWFLGLAAETAYLLATASSERFQKLVRGLELQASKASYQEKVESALVRLSADSQERYRKLLAQCREVLGLTRTLDEDEVLSLRHLRSGGLNQLTWIFLRLLSSREALRDNLERVDPEALAQEVQNIEHRIEGESVTDPESPLVRALHGTLEIQKRRLENYERAGQSLRVIDAELRRIEQQVLLIREETAITGKPEILSDRLDAITGTLSETNRFMEQNAEIFGTLGADPLGSAPVDLPDVPPPIEQLEG
jgi:hypothetical protein